jgi:hypothetical protein
VELGEWHRWWKQRGGAAIRRILMEDWDPIGVRDWPDAVTEYDTYVGGVGEMLHEGASAAEVEAYLNDMREEAIGLGPSSSGRERDVAARLVEWYRAEMAAAERGSPAS